MKKLSYQQRRRFRIRNNRILRRRAVLLARYEAYNTKLATYIPAPKQAPPRKFPYPISGVWNPKTKFKRGNGKTKAPFIIPPADFSFKRNHSEVASFLQHLRSDIYCNGNEPVKGIDFTAIKHISHGAALVLVAELHRWQSFKKVRLRAVRYDLWDPSVSRLLGHLGIFDFLKTPGMQNVKVPPDIMDEHYIRYQKGVEVDGSLCGQLIDHLKEISGSLPAENMVYDGLVEAIKNSKHHAYSDNNRWYGVDQGTWIMSAAYSQPKKTLTVSVYDLGVGIPATLPRSNGWAPVQEILARIGGQSDEKMIAAAMEYGRTRTQLDGRGKGLPIMMRLMDTHEGFLRILSGTGEAILASNSKGIEMRKHRIPIEGTLIEWQISRGQS